jgi:hypothetical protein
MLHDPVLDACGDFKPCRHSRRLLQNVHTRESAGEQEAKMAPTAIKAVLNR